MERYELVEGKSAKFWEADVEGATLTVRFGRIGTSGQSKDKTFADAAAAKKEKEKLVREKTGKGYVLSGDAAAAPRPKAAPAPSEPPTASKPAATKPKPSVTKRSEPERPEAKRAPTIQPAPVPPTTPTDEGHGRLFDGVPLATRLRPGRHMSAAEAWDLVRSLIGAVPAHDQHAATVADLRKTFAGEAPPPVDAAAATTWTENILAVFAPTLPQHWQRKSPEQTAYCACLEAFVRWVVETAGARVAAELADANRPDYAKSGTYKNFSWCEPLHLALRAALVHAPERDYDAAVAILEASANAAADWPLNTYFAFILADDRPPRHPLHALAVLEAATSAGVDVAADLCFLPLVVDTPPDEAARWRTKRSYHLYMSYCDLTPAEAAATLIAVARAAGVSALPPLDWLLHYMTDEQRTEIAKAILETREPGALAVILPVLHEKWIRAALDAAAEVYPASTFLQCIGALAAGRTEPAIRARVADAVDRHGVDTVRAWTKDAGAKAVTYLDKLLETRNTPLAAKDNWPRVLRDPPWRQKQRAKEDIVLDIAPIATPLAFAFPKIEPDYWRGRNARVLDDLGQLPNFIAETEATTPVHSWNKAQAPKRALPDQKAKAEDALAWLGERIEQLHQSTYYFGITPYYGLIAGMEKQPDTLALQLWSMTGVLVTLIYHTHWAEIVAAMVTRFGARAVPDLLRAVEADPISLLLAVHPVDEGGVAPFAARALLKLKKARTPALAWLRRHPATAAMRLVPDAVGKAGATRDAAEHTLRWLVADKPDGRAVLDAAVADYANVEPRIVEAIAQVLDRDPLARVPVKVAKPPAWVVPSALARPQLTEGGALPDEAMLALVEMLSFSTPDAVYAGIPLMREACTAESLAAFAWDLFSAWMAAGTPSKDGWALRAIGWFGDDSCARELTRLIRRWPGEAAHARAVIGLDVLVDIGSDVALMNLNGIAEKLKFKGLQEKAREKIAVLAEARGLTPAELSDRLAPDLDLDERGGLDLVFGDRMFRAGFDEFLKPWVKDAAGQRLKDLPKPNKSDDPERSAEAVARWTALKKDARAVASLQLNRLEAMLATSRRVRPDVFWLFFATHPLVRHLAQRLVWAVFADADPRTTPSLAFRVAEDLSVTDAKDEPLTLDVSANAAGLIGLVHPLHLPNHDLAPWGALFGDYEIAQPFPQLGRETFAFTEAENAASETARFDGIRIETNRLRGMGPKGWPLGTVADHGVAGWIEHEVVFPDGGTVAAALTFENGIMAGAPEFEEKAQTLRALTLDNPWAARGGNVRTFGELDPVTASELLRGPSLLVETRLR